MSEKFEESPESNSNSENFVMISGIENLDIWKNSNPQAADDSRWYSVQLSDRERSNKPKAVVYSAWGDIIVTPPSDVKTEERNSASQLQGSLHLGWGSEESDTWEPQDLSAREKNKFLQDFEIDTHHLTSNEAYNIEIYQYLRSIEFHQESSLNQINILGEFRAQMVEFLIFNQAQGRFPMTTLYLAVAFIDQYMCKKIIEADDFQMMCLMALVVAIKLDHETNVNISTFITGLDNKKYSVKSGLMWEEKLLFTLDFKLLIPTRYDFLTYYCAKSDDKVKLLAMYLCELTLLDSFYSKFLPSHIAASVLALARYTLELEIWSRELEKISQYSFNDFYEVFSAVETTFARSVRPNYKFRFSKEKYASARYLRTSAAIPRHIFR